MTITLDDAIRCALDGDGVLFVGAGLSFLSRRSGDRPVPDAVGLIDLLLEQSPGTPSKHPLDRVAGKAIRDKGVEFVFDLLTDSFVVESVDDKLKTLYGLPWKRIYTTNYDNAPELSRQGRSVSSVTLDDPQKNAVLGSIVHLNGFVRRISPTNLHSALLLTDASYAADRLRSTGWLSFFERDIRTSRAVIFVGYSLYDLDIDQVLFETESLSKKAFFFISPDADDVEISTLERYGVVVTGGVDALLNRINSVKADYDPPKFPTGFTALREIVGILSESTDVPAAKKIENQLVYGILPESEVLAAEPAFDIQLYVTIREQDLAARAAIQEGHWRDILITGELGSGKSASTLTMAAFLKDKGYKVYYAEHGESLIPELHKLAEYIEKVAVIFDGYSGFRPAIAEYAARRAATHRIIMTERSGTHEFIGEFIENTPQLGPVFEAILDKITYNDAKAFEALTNFGGFWGERAGASVGFRQRYITDQLEGSLYRLLLEIIKSEKIQARLRDLVNPISNDRTVSKIFCSALIANSVGAQFSISEWQYWFSRTGISALLSKYKEQVQHFLVFDSGRIYVRNGMLSTHILHSFMDDEMIRESLISLYERAELSANEGRKWTFLRTELMKFSSIEPMFSGPTKGANIFSYYDNIRALGGTRNNPDYWLQLGIAATVFGDLSRGKTCFENAYARERAKASPNLTRIDNYAARFDMKCAVSSIDSHAAFDLFINANDRLMRQVFLDTNRHYPFKTGRYLSEIAAKHYDAWNQGQQKKFKAAVVKMNNKAIEWKGSKKQSHIDVDTLIKETKELLNKIP